MLQRCLLWHGSLVGSHHHCSLQYVCVYIYIYNINIFLRQNANMPMSKHMRQLTIKQVFYQEERTFHSQESNRQTLSWDLGISQPSSGSLGSSWTIPFNLSMQVMSIVACSLREVCIYLNQPWMMITIIYLWLRVGSHKSQVPNPTHVSKSRHEGQVPTCEPQGITKIWLN